MDATVRYKLITEHDIAKAIEAYADVYMISPVTASTYLTTDHKMYKRWLDGESTITVNRARVILTKIRNNWPVGIPMPEVLDCVA